MAKYKQFMIRCDDEDLKRIESIAKVLQRNRSDAVRYVIRNTYESILINAQLERDELEQIGWNMIHLPD